jgi:hypothetical protein
LVIEFRGASQVKHRITCPKKPIQKLIPTKGLGYHQIFCKLKIKDGFYCKRLCGQPFNPKNREKVGRKGFYCCFTTE